MNALTLCYVFTFLILIYALIIEATPTLIVYASCELVGKIMWICMYVSIIHLCLSTLVPEIRVRHEKYAP